MLIRLVDSSQNQRPCGGGGAAEDLVLLTDDGILPAEQLATVMDAGALIQAAGAQAEQLLAEARRQAQAMRDAVEGELQALRDQTQAEIDEILGLAQQEADGAQQQGYADGQRQAAEHWHALHAQLQRAQAARRDNTEQALTQVVMQAVLRIVDAQPREALFRQALATVQGLLPPQGRASLRVAPEELEAARRASADSPALAASELQLELQADATLAAGSAVFESALGRLDTSLELQLAGLRSALERAQNKAELAGEGGRPAA